MLRDLINDAKTNSEAMLSLIERFKPLIQSRARQLRYPEAEQDLTYEFILLIHAIELTKISDNEGALVNYIKTAINNCTMKLSVIHAREGKQLEYSDEMGVAHGNTQSTDDVFFWETIRSVLSDVEFEIIDLTFVYGYNGQEIAIIRGTSRQAVHKHKKNALEKLHKAFGE